MLTSYSVLHMDNWDGLWSPCVPMPVQSSSLPTTATSLSTFTVSMFCCKSLNTRFKPSYWASSRWLPQTVFWVLILCGHRITSILWNNVVPPPARAWLNFIPADCAIMLKMEAERSLKYCCQTYCHYVTSSVGEQMATEWQHKPAFHATNDPFFPPRNVAQNQTVRGRSNCH